MNKNYIIAILLYFLVVVSQTIYAQEPCGTDILHQKKLASDPTYKANFQKMEGSLQKHIAKKMANDATAKIENTVYQIPVVVHVIHTGNEIGTLYNPTDSTIVQMIKKLNETFRAIYSGTDIEIEFALAKRSPNCTPTTGINRVNGSVIENYRSKGINFDINGDDLDEEVKALSYWSNIDYYNIWIVHKIGSGVVGYASFPNYTSPQTDGVVLLWEAMNEIENLAHEIGHGLMLYHTFARIEVDRDSNSPTDCPENTDCATQGDQICDTDPHAIFNGSCKTQTCDTTISQATLRNYMSYCTSQDNFTPNQKTRMRTTLETLRGGLLTSLGATPPSSILPISACVPTNTGLKTNVGITRFVLDKLNIPSQDSKIEENNYSDRVCNQQIELDANSERTIKVETSTTLHNVKVYVDYNNNGNFTDEGEEIVSGNTTEIEGVHTFNTLYKVPNFGILFNQSLHLRVVASSDIDGIATSCEVFKGQAEDYSLFIKKIACSIDSVEIGTQSECNSETNTYSQSLTVIYSNPPPTGNLLVNNQSFAITQSPQIVTLTNLQSDAKPVNITASFSEESTCQFVKNDAFIAPLACASIKNSITVYPNPTSNEFLYSLNTDKEGEYTVQLFDATGRLIFEGKETKTGVTLEGTINLETQPKGLYLLQISDSKTIITTRIVKE